LEAAMKKIALEGRGIVLYLRQEGRGIGLINKIRAYRLQEQGADTVEANAQLGFAADLRNYHIAKPILDHFGITKVRLITNNPHKIASLERAGIAVVERIPLVLNRNAFNERYLNTKATKLGHLISIPSGGGMLLKSCEVTTAITS
jgi:GTP cyclohydrolase II